jgi:hypothetical protein
MMTSEEQVKLVYDLKSQVGIVGNSVSNLAEAVKSLAGEVKEIREGMKASEVYCSSHCTGMFVSKETFVEAISPLKKMMWLNIATVLTFVGGVVLFLLSFKAGIR